MCSVLLIRGEMLPLRFLSPLRKYVICIGVSLSCPHKGRANSPAADARCRKMCFTLKGKGQDALSQRGGADSRLCFFVTVSKRYLSLSLSSQILGTAPPDDTEALFLSVYPCDRRSFMKATTSNHRGPLTISRQRLKPSCSTPKLYVCSTVCTEVNRHSFTENPEALR